MTLDQTWKNCLRMWKWVSEKYDGNIDVITLKYVWLNKYWRNKKKPIACCFFCEYSAQDSGDTECSKCPGILVNERFRCQNKTYNYYKKPKAFYKKLLHLNEIRKQKRGKK